MTRLSDPDPTLDKDPPATWQWKDVVWYNVFFFVLWHISAMYAAITVLPYATWQEILVLWVGLWVFSGLGITMGAHRLWSHKGYKACLPLRIFLMIANTMAYEGTIFQWSRDHRIHHKGSETNADPHNARRGFFFAHCGWVMVRKQPQVKTEGAKISCQDLLEDFVVTFQMRYYLPLVFLICYAFPTWLGYYYFNNPWTGFWLGGVFRHVWVLHMTWFVNSIDHFYGARPYDPDIQPCENLLVAIVALGEGWHNYHHKFPADYATSEFGCFSGNWNPTKTLIDLCALFGLAYDLRRSRTAAATRIRVAEEMQRRKEEELKLKGITHEETWYERVTGKLLFRTKTKRRKAGKNPALL